MYSKTVRAIYLSIHGNACSKRPHGRPWALSWLQSILSARRSSLPTAPSGGRNAAEVVAPAAVIIRVHSSEKHPQPNGEPAQHMSLNSVKPTKLRELYFIIFSFWGGGTRTKADRMALD